MKKTRKSLFISTVLMVVLLVVAISTATFAWYSAQSTATAQNAKLTTAATTDANIALSTVDGTWSNVVQLTAATDIHPMVPISLPTKNSVAETTDVSFNEGVLELSNGAPVFKTQVNSVSPWKPTYFKVKNQDASTARYVPITITVTDINVYDPAAPTTPLTDGESETFVADFKKMLRIAIFATNTMNLGTANPLAEPTTDTKFLGLYVNNGTAYYGTPVGGKSPTDYGAGPDHNGLQAFGADTTTADWKFNLRGGGTESDIVAYAWFEGELLTTTHQNTMIGFNLYFSAGGQVSVYAED